MWHLTRKICFSRWELKWIHREDGRWLYCFRYDEVTKHVKEDIFDTILWSCSFCTLLGSILWTWILMTFFQFFSSFSKNVSCGSSNHPHDHNFFKMEIFSPSPHFGLYLNHFGPLEPNLRLKTFWPQMDSDPQKSKNGLHPLTGVGGGEESPPVPPYIRSPSQAGKFFGRGHAKSCVHKAVYEIRDR